MLEDREHVEAVAIMRRMADARTADLDPAAWVAAEQWLRENHPAPEVYMAAVASMAGTTGEAE